MHFKYIHLFAILFPFAGFASGAFQTTAEILASYNPINTECATRAFADALAEDAAMNYDTINEYTSENEIQNWIYDVFRAPETLMAVLACPEIADADDNETIRFMPIKYTFPHGREIVINYETQPKVLNQHLLLSAKTELSTDEVSPEINQFDEHATWTYTDPAWYAVMVTRPGALSEFVGPGKNNTVSFQYIYDHVDSLYPQNLDGWCSTKTPIGARANNAMVHDVMRERTAKHDGDKNNYYIAGSRDLRWISYGEIALDIALNILTGGGALFAEGALKGARTSKIMLKIGKNIRALMEIDRVKDYVRASGRLAMLSRRSENISKVEKSLKNVDKLEKALARAQKGTRKYDRITDSLRAAKKTHADNLAKLGKDADKINSVADLDKLADMRKTGANEIKEIEKTMSELAKNDDVAKYKKQYDTLKDVAKYSKDLRAFKKARTGNIAHRAWQGIKNTAKSAKTARNGTKTLDKAAKIARSGAKSGRVRDWLFHSTRRGLGRVARVTSDFAALHFVLGLIGDFWDWTYVETGDYTNGIKMKPFLLLSASDIEGEDNVVNYGSWLKWTGDSTNAADDDAAYLQAMDFAQKFYQDLTEMQEEVGRYPCDVDIFVVRPIIRNPDTEFQQLFWLIMNDVPWSTANPAR